MFNYFKNKIEKRKFRKELEKLKKNNPMSELYIKHYLNFDRGGLFIISHDLEQLKLIKESLENRGHECILYKNHCSGFTNFKLILTDLDSRDIDEQINKFLDFVEKYLGNGRPIPNANFFTDYEKEIISKWKEIV